MGGSLLKHENPVVLMGPLETDPEILSEILTVSSDIVAADGGADRALAQGLTPSAVIGDFDSVSDGALRAIPPERRFQSADQDTTDFEKCLQAITAPLILAPGFIGGRTDHGLAVLAALMRFCAQRCIVAGGPDIAFHAPRDLTLDLPAGARVSLFPLAEVEGVSTGLRWPIDGLRLAPGGRLGTSNEATGRVRLAVDGPGLLVILPVRFLRVAAAALAGSTPFP